MASAAAGFKLFGVQIGSDSHGESGIRNTQSRGTQGARTNGNLGTGGSEFVSDEPTHQSSKSGKRKKGKPWTVEEHRSFLEGLKKIGKGHWKRIATRFVHTRSPAQVASHAQKYFIRMATTDKKGRKSVFDVPLNDDTSKVISGSEPSFEASSEGFNAASMATPAAASGTGPLPPMMGPAGNPNSPAFIDSAIPCPAQTATTLPNIVNLSSQNSQEDLAYLVAQMWAAPPQLPRQAQGSSGWPTQAMRMG